MEENKIRLAQKNEKFQRYIDTFQLPDVSFIEIPAPQQEECSSEVEEIEKDLSSSSLRAFQFEEIDKLREDFLSVDIKYITTDHVKNFISRLPQFEKHLESYPKLLEIFAFLTWKKELSELIYPVFKGINFNNYMNYPLNVKNNLTIIIYNMIRFIDESKDVFKESFFEYFITYFRSPSLYQSEKLNYHIDVAADFIVFSDINLRIELFSIFIKFIHHISPIIIQSALKAIIKTIIASPDILSYSNDYNDNNFFSRLYYLGIQNNDTTQLVLIFLQHIIKNNNVQCSNYCYHTINNLLICLLTKDNIDSRTESISLASFAFANHYFMESLDNGVELIQTFLTQYPQFKFREKKESILCFANLMVNFPKIVDQYIQEDIFFTPFQDIFEVDDPLYLSPFLDGLYYFLTSSEIIYKLKNQHNFIYQKCNELLNSQNDGIRNRAQIILSYMTKNENNNLY